MTTIKSSVIPPSTTHEVPELGWPGHLQLLPAIFVRLKAHAMAVPDPESKRPRNDRGKSMTRVSVELLRNSIATI